MGDARRVSHRTRANAARGSRALGVGQILLDRAKRGGVEVRTAIASTHSNAAVFAIAVLTSTPMPAYGRRPSSPQCDSLRASPADLGSVPPR